MIFPLASSFPRLLGPCFCPSRAGRSLPRPAFCPAAPWGLESVRARPFFRGTGPFFRATGRDFGAPGCSCWLRRRRFRGTAEPEGPRGLLARLGKRSGRADAKNKNTKRGSLAGQRGWPCSVGTGGGVSAFTSTEITASSGFFASSATQGGKKERLSLNPSWTHLRRAPGPAPADNIRRRSRPTARPDPAAPAPRGPRRRCRRPAAVSSGSPPGFSPCQNGVGAHPASGPAVSFSSPPFLALLPHR